MSSDSSTVDIDDDAHIESQQSSRSNSVQQLPNLSEDGKAQIKRLPRNTSASGAPFSVIYEVPSNVDTNDVTFAPPPAAASAGYNNQHRRSTGTGPHERQLSILDPMSDRVSTILVWQNLLVSTRVDKRKQFIQNLRSKGSPLTSKRLLHNVSGAITGGLWAVMGKLAFRLHESTSKSKSSPV